MAAQPARSASEQISGAAQTHPQYFKAGTIERIYDDRGTADGRRLPFQSKAIAAYFILKAQKQRDYSFIMSEAQICERLGMDGKTFRKYLAPLVESGLVSVDKNRELATRRFSCKSLFERYREDAVNGTKVVQIGKVSQTVAGDADRESRAPDRESAPAVREIAPAERESFPNSLDPSSTSFDLDTLKERWGLTTTDGLERLLQFMAETFANFAVTERRQRSIIKRYGVYGVAGALAYVKQQQMLATVKSPAGLLDWALQNGRCSDAEPWLSGKVSPTEGSGPNPPQPNDAVKDMLVGDLWDGVLKWLEPRLTAGEYGMLVKPIRAAAFDDGTLTLHVGSSWLRDRVREKVAARIVEALETLIGPTVQITFEIHE